MENKGSQPTIVSSPFHWQKDPGPCCGAHLYTSQIYTAASGGNPVNFTTGFHTYAVEWDKNASMNANEIRYYVDGNQFMTVTQNGAMSDANFTTAKNIIFNLAVGGDFGSDPNGRPSFRRQCSSTMSVFGIVPPEHRATTTETIKSMPPTTSPAKVRRSKRYRAAHRRIR